MGSFFILAVLYLVKTTHAGSHSLWYFGTMTEGPSPFPELVVVGMVDDIPVAYYDSVDRMITLRQPWHQEEDNAAEAQLKRMLIARTILIMKGRLKHMKEHFNHSVTLHTFQRIAGCELDDDGTERFQAKEAYNKKDILSYNPQSDTWSSLFPEIKMGSWLRESYKGLNHYVVQPLCIRELKSYVHQGRSFLKRRVSPRVKILQKQVGGAGGVEVICLATGFYPRRIELRLQRDNHPVPEGELIRGDILPNGDGTYQLRMSLRVSAEELRKGNLFTCSVRHVSMDNKLDITWDSQPKPDIALILVPLVAALSVAVLIIAGIVILRKKKSNVPDCSHSGINKAEMERMNPSEGVANDAEGVVEMEKTGRVKGT